MKSFVNDLLDNQQIRRRRYSGPSGERARGRQPQEKTIKGKIPGRNFSGKPAFRPAGVVSLFKQNARFIDNIQQNPRRDNQRGFSQGFPQSSPRPSAEFQTRRPRAGNPRVFRTESVSRRAGSFFREIFDRPDDTGREQISRGRTRAKQKFSLFSVPAIPFTALLILGLGIFFVAYNQAGTLDWTGREVVGSEKDEGSQYNLALYAGINSVEETPEAGEEIPLDLMETFSWQNYKVRKGDSVSGIAAAHSVSMDAIIASNGITNARVLRAGEELRIPNMDGIPYTVKNGDSLNGISGAMGVPVEAILDANDLQSDTINAGMSLFIPGARMNRNDLKIALGELFIYPLKGARLSSPFGWRNDPISGVRRHHSAIDLSAYQGTSIKAVMDGRVSSKGYNGVYGNFVILTHSDGLQTLYAHMHTVVVKSGERVTQGSQIGTVGSTGYSTGPHLHFAVFKNNRAVNPLDYLNPRS